ncbi:MAG: ABC transporter ATP-binding protein [Leptolyngbyaceae bacterium]|nr:ABC transporter ATP-binding protein [Leptolyngbyaceae bacterium]
MIARLAQMPKTWHLVWRASRYWTVAWMAVLILQGLLPAATVYLSRSVVDGLVATAGAGLSQESIQPVLVPVLLIAGAMLLTEILNSTLQWIRTAQSELVRDYISALVHTQSIEVDFGFYESSEFYDHLDRARSDAGGRSIALLESTGSLLQGSITLLSLVALLLPYGIGMPLLLLTSALPAFYVMLRLNRQHHAWWRQTTTDRRRLQYYEMLLTISQSAAEIRLFRLGDYFQSAYQTLRARLRNEHIRLIRNQSLGRFAAGAIALLITGIALCWMGRQVLLGLFTLGDVALFYQAFSQSKGILSNLLSNLGQIYRNSLFVNDLFTFLHLRPQVVDPPTPRSFPNPLTTELRFKNVSFSYPGADQPVLTDFNLTVPVGKVVAIVGDNGAGKSTLIKLLCRFYDPDTGAIEFDGVDLRQMAVEDLRQHITVLFQMPVPYYLTAADNITLGDLSNRATQQEIKTAAKGAGVHEAIAHLPQGYDTLMGKWFPGGTELSGGQWQRLALARAFFRRAPMIVLDEPTSAMDPWAEFDWLERFRTLAQGRTALVITHRFTLAMRADVIHVMRKGQIVESGSHDELLAQNGLYAQSWRSQMHTHPNPSVVNA